MTLRRSMLWPTAVFVTALAAPTLFWRITPAAAHGGEDGHRDRDHHGDRGRDHGHGHHHDGHHHDGDHGSEDCTAVRCAAQATIAEQCPCDEATSNWRYVVCVAKAAKRLDVPRKCRGAIIRCAFNSTCGRDDAVTCNKRGHCGIARSAEQCERRGGTVGTGPSCCTCPETQCCVPTSPGGAFDSPMGAFTCEVVSPEQCEALNGIDRGPGMCQPDPCVESTTTTVTVPSTTSTSITTTTAPAETTTSTTLETTSTTVETTSTTTIETTSTSVPARTSTTSSSTTTTTVGSPSGAFLEA
jgi:hypothetical protein